MQNLNYDHLYYFYVIAREGSIVNACKRLHLTQSTLSNQLKSLETYFGQKLFERKTRKLEINEAGKIALEYATNIFNLGDELVEKLSHKDIRRKLTIHIGITPSISKYHVDEFLLDLWKHPGISVKLHESNLTGLLRELEYRNLDLILSDSSVSRFKLKIENIKLMPRKIFFVGSEKFRHLKRGFPRAMNGVPFIHVTPESKSYAYIKDYFKIHNVTPDIIGEIDDCVLLRLSVEKGVGIAALSSNAVEKSIKQKRLFKLGELNECKMHIWAIKRSDCKLNKIIDEAIQTYKIEKRKS